MHKSSSNLNLKPSILFLILAILIGGYIRLAAVLESDFPINDGGLFYTMTHDLAANNWQIPAFTTYNHLNIPFAYPPLAFYLTGFLSQLTGWELLDIFRIMPVIFTISTIPAFFLLARELLEDDFHIAIATFIFAVLPPTFDWLIMGGGITRAPAFLFALLTLTSISRLYRQKKIQYIFTTAFLAALTIFTHPETALHTAASALVFFLFWGRTKAGFWKSAAVAMITIALTSPWWAAVLTHHGFTPFSAAAQTGWHGYAEAIKFFIFDFTNEFGLETIGALALIGFFLMFAKREIFLITWFLIIFISEPRSAPLYVTPLMAIFASFTLLQILSLLNRLVVNPRSQPPPSTPLDCTPAKVLFALLAGQWIFSGLAITMLLFNANTITTADKKAFDWIATNTPIESRFTVITGNMPLSDPVSEWFPTLTGRISVGTAQGYEWLKEEPFEAVLTSSLELQRCADQAISCITNWANENDHDFSYVYIHKMDSRDGNFQTPYDSALADLFMQSNEFDTVYNTPEISIFQRK